MHMSSASCFNDKMPVEQPRRQGKHFSSFLMPPHMWPQRWILLHALEAYSYNKIVEITNNYFLLNFYQLQRHLYNIVYGITSYQTFLFVACTVLWKFNTWSSAKTTHFTVDSFLINNTQVSRIFAEFNNPFKSIRIDQS